MKSVSVPMRDLFLLFFPFETFRHLLQFLYLAADPGSRAF